MPLLEQSESQLVDACRRGERDAFRTLFERHRGQVYSIALRYAGDPETALDIAQDTFIKLLSRLESFRGESGFETWLYRMVVNSCLDHKRKAWRWQPLVDEIACLLRAPDRSATEELLRHEMHGEVQKAVAALPPDLRIAIVLRYTEGLSYDEMAEVLATKPGTVASRLNRAHGLLGRRLAHLKGADRG